jgi:hypothetical protein
MCHAGNAHMVAVLPCPALVGAQRAPLQRCIASGERTKLLGTLRRALAALTTNISSSTVA